MFRRFTRAIIAAAAVGAAIATSGLAGTANAATRSIPVLYTSYFAGYHTASSDTMRFGYVATTVPVAACQIGTNPSTNPDAHIELFGGAEWSADIDVTCDGGASSVSFYDQLSAITQAAGTFRLSPRVGDRVRISISRNVSGHQDSFTATDLRTGRSQTVRVTTPAAVVYQHAFVGSAVWSAPASLEALMSANWSSVYQMPVLYSRFPRTFSAAYRRCKNGYAPRYTTAPSLPWRPSHHQPLANRHGDR